MLLANNLKMAKYLPILFNQNISLLVQTPNGTIDEFIPNVHLIKTSNLR